MLKVLIVDDEPGMRLGAARTLAKFRVDLPDMGGQIGFSPTEAEDGATTLAALEEEHFDLVLLDYKLPDMNGMEILEHIREHEYDLLAIMMTAYASLEVAISATKTGAFDFLAKPFSPDELRAVVRKTAGSLLLQRHARRLEEEKRQVRFQFLSVLSHELKAPLNAVEGYLNIMDDKIAGDKIVDYEKMISRSLARIGGMRKLIFDMLDLTRIESGQKQRELQQLNLVEIARDAVDTMLPDAAQRGISMNIDAPAELVLTADRGEMDIIFNNLISNAVKYNKDNGKVDIRLRREEASAVIEVADTGIGLSREEQEKLFKEFTRIRNEKTRDIEGSGLGLSILKRLSGLYRGDVKVSSEPDVGTAFTVTLRDAEKEADNE